MEVAGNKRKLASVFDDEHPSSLSSSCSVSDPMKRSTSCRCRCTAEVAAANYEFADSYSSSEAKSERIAMLKSRFADTISRAQQDLLLADHNKNNMIEKQNQVPQETQMVGCDNNNYLELKKAGRDHHHQAANKKKSDNMIKKKENMMKKQKQVPYETGKNNTIKKQNQVPYETQMVSCNNNNNNLELMKKADRQHHHQAANKKKNIIKKQNQVPNEPRKKNMINKQNQVPHKTQMVSCNYNNNNYLELKKAGRDPHHQAPNEKNKENCSEYLEIKRSNHQKQQQQQQQQQRQKQREAARKEINAIQKTLEFNDTVYVMNEFQKLIGSKPHEPHYLNGYVMFHLGSSVSSN